MVTEKETFKNEKANSLPDAFKQLEAARMHYTEELLTHPKKHKKINTNLTMYITLVLLNHQRKINQ